MEIRERTAEEHVQFTWTAIRRQAMEKKSRTAKGKKTAKIRDLSVRSKKGSAVKGGLSSVNLRK